MGRLYNEREAELFGRRKICAREGHDIERRANYGGGEQMNYDRLPGMGIASCDDLFCERCDAIITVTYKEIGEKQ